MHIWEGNFVLQTDLWSRHKFRQKGNRNMWTTLVFAQAKWVTRQAMWVPWNDLYISAHQNWAQKCEKTFLLYQRQMPNYEVHYVKQYKEKLLQQFCPYFSSASCHVLLYSLSNMIQVPVFYLILPVLEIMNHRKSTGTLILTTLSCKAIKYERAVISFWLPFLPTWLWQNTHFRDLLHIYLFFELSYSELFSLTISD